MNSDFAVLDLGSNSFHLLVTRLDEQGEFQVVDRLKVRVRLASGLDENKCISEKMQRKALDTLSQFGERLANIPPQNVQVVATDTFRKAKNGQALLIKSQKALGFPIGLLSGVEEARLIFTGVSEEYPSSEKRLVIDIGGGSTELIYGKEEKPIELASLKMGCVSWTSLFFGNGDISESKLNHAIQKSAQLFVPLRHRFNDLSPSIIQGTSGTIRAIGKVLLANNISNGEIDANGLQWFRNQLLQYSNIYNLVIPGLSESRREVIIGGYCILQFLFDELDIQSLIPLDTALREGVMVELIGRQQGIDIRNQTIQRLCHQMKAHSNQAQRVQSLCQIFFEQNQHSLSLNLTQKQYLIWAAQLHEIGMSIAFSGYQRHGAYILHNSDLRGFTKRGQSILAMLVFGHRSKITKQMLQNYLPHIPKPILYLLVFLRLSVRFCRARGESIPKGLELKITGSTIRIKLDPKYLETHPLTQANLIEEKEQLNRIKMTLELYSFDISPKALQSNP